ncbi:MAG: hypothetical protein JO061_06475 [Acidobacteriaceae bacterium]|nr:hypothetical protein [Acidobacteriaceae bacterium]
MKHIASITFMVTLGVASAFAQETHIKMRFSGTSENSATSLQEPNTSNDADSFAGHSALGSFTVRLIRAIANSPSSSSTCSGANQLYLLELAGGGVFRFEDGTLLYVNLTEGSDCIDFVPTVVAHCSLTFKISGGTGRFKNASGVLTMTETVVPVLNALNDPNNPVFFAATGEFTGTVSGICEEMEHPDEVQ